jgi:hypothetical protein
LNQGNDVYLQIKGGGRGVVAAIVSEQEITLANLQGKNFETTVLTASLDKRQIKNLT